MRSKPLHPTHPLRIPPLAVVKMFLLASISIAACVWALIRFYTHPREPMTIPVQNTQIHTDAAAGEIPAPDLEPAP